MAPPTELPHSLGYNGGSRSQCSDDATAPSFSRGDSAASGSAPTGAASSCIVTGGGGLYLSAAASSLSTAAAAPSCCPSRGCSTDVSLSCPAAAAAAAEGGACCCSMTEADGNCRDTAKMCVVGLQAASVSTNHSVSVSRESCFIDAADCLKQQTTTAVAMNGKGSAEGLSGRQGTASAAGASAAAGVAAGAAAGGLVGGSVVASSATEPTSTYPPYRPPKAPYIPYNPYCLSRLVRQLLELTELPFMILWVYFAYFLVIVALTANRVKSRVWLSALVAGTLVGIGLNANAYRAIMYRGYPDVGIIVRFFLIPFGVSALSGLTHSLRDQFLLVFPVDPVELLVAITVPAVVVCSLMLGRILLLYKKNIPIDLRSFFLNGTIYS